MRIVGSEAVIHAVFPLSGFRVAVLVSAMKPMQAACQRAEVLFVRQIV